MEASELVDGYLAAGYSGILITDHFCLPSFEYLGNPMDAGCVNRFLEGYRQVKALGDQRGLKVYKGAELRFYENDNDYIMINYPDSLLENPEKLFCMGLAEFYPLAKAAGAMLIQAHPYRGPCRPAEPKYLDGVEIYNMHPNHDSHNDLAVQFGASSGLIQTSGSDCHMPHHLGRGGIRAEELPEDEAGLVRLLRSGEFTLIGSEKI